MTPSIEDQIAELRVEIAAQRMISRTVLAYILTSQNIPLSSLVAMMNQACEQMAPSRHPVAGMDPEVQEAAHKLLVQRTLDFVRDLGSLAPATSTPHHTAPTIQAGRRT